MNYKIEEKPAFSMYGVSTTVNANQERAFVEIPDFWTTCISDGTVDRIRTASGLGENGQIHSVLCNRDGEKLSYMIGYFLPQGGLPEGFELLEIPNQTYVIFSTGLYPDGQSDIHNFWKRIWGEWFRTRIMRSQEVPSLK